MVPEEWGSSVRCGTLSACVPLPRWASLTNLKLRAICKVLDLEQKGSQVDLINRILIFLSAPKNSGKVGAP